MLSPKSGERILNGSPREIPKTSTSASAALSKSAHLPRLPSTPVQQGSSHCSALLPSVYTAALAACHSPCLQSQRKLQLSLEAHGRYITSLIEQEGLKDKLPTMAPLQSSGGMQQQPHGEAPEVARLVNSLPDGMLTSLRGDRLVSHSKHFNVALRPASSIW